MSDQPDLPKLRRFALTIGLILFVYSIAGVELDPNETIKPLGLPFKIKQPGLIGLGLLITSIYASARYWYFAMQATFSPLYERRLLRQGHMPPSLAEKVAETVRLELKWNQLSFPFESKNVSDVNAVVAALHGCGWKLNNDLSSVVSRLFPRLAWLETRTGTAQPGPLVPYDQQHGQDLQKQGLESLPDDNPASVTLRITGILLPKRWNPVVVYHDFDYTLPLWVNGLAIATYLLPLLPWRKLYYWVGSIIQSALC